MIITKKNMALILASTFTLGAFTFSSAESKIKKITANINYGIAMRLNGNTFDPVDKETGKVFKPITYEGRTYLPVRIIAEAFKIAVDYDSATQTVILGEREGKGVKLTDLNADFVNYSYSRTVDPNILAVENNTYDFGIVRKPELTFFYDSKYTVKLSNRYQKLNFKAYLRGTTGGKIKLVDTDKDIIIKEVDIKDSQVVDIEAPVGGVNNLELVTSGDTGGADVRLFILEPYLK